jgi:hypothetical protein
MRRLRDPLWRWLLSAVFSLALCLGLWWWWVREPLLEGLARVVGFASPWLWPDTVLGVGLQDHSGWIITLLPPLLDPPRLFMALPLSFNRAVVIFPLFWGLTLATPGTGAAASFVPGHGDPVASGVDNGAALRPVSTRSIPNTPARTHRNTTG